MESPTEQKANIRRAIAARQSPGYSQPTSVTTVTPNSDDDRSSTYNFNLDSKNPRLYLVAKSDCNNNSKFPPGSIFNEVGVPRLNPTDTITKNANTNFQPQPMLVPSPPQHHDQHQKAAAALQQKYELAVQQQHQQQQQQQQNQLAQLQSEYEVQLQQLFQQQQQPGQPVQGQPVQQQTSTMIGGRGGIDDLLDELSDEDDAVVRRRRRYGSGTASRVARSHTGGRGGIDDLLDELSDEDDAVVRRRRFGSGGRQLRSNKRRRARGLSSSFSSRNTNRQIRQEMEDYDSAQRPIEKPPEPAAHFPAQLHDMLEGAERQQLTDIVSWCPDGRSFCILQPNKMLPLLTPYFRLTKYKSFLRQLQGYNFARTGEQKNTVSHPQFQRGRRCMSMAMKPKKVACRVKLGGANAPPSAANALKAHQQQMRLGIHREQKEDGAITATRAAAAATALDNALPLVRRLRREQEDSTAAARELTATTTTAPPEQYLQLVHDLEGGNGIVSVRNPYAKNGRGGSVVPQPQQQSNDAGNNNRAFESNEVQLSSQPQRGGDDNHGNVVHPHPQPHPQQYPQPHDDFAPAGMGNDLSSTFYEENPQALAFLDVFGSDIFENNQEAFLFEELGIGNGQAAPPLVLPGTAQAVARHWQDPQVQPPLTLTAVAPAAAPEALVERHRQDPHVLPPLKFAGVAVEHFPATLALAAGTQAPALAERHRQDPQVQPLALAVDAQAAAPACASTGTTVTGSAGLSLFGESPSHASHFWPSASSTHDLYPNGIRTALIMTNSVANNGSTSKNFVKDVAGMKRVAVMKLTTNNDKSQDRSFDVTFESHKRYTDAGSGNRIGALKKYLKPFLEALYDIKDYNPETKFNKDNKTASFLYNVQNNFLDVLDDEGISPVEDEQIIMLVGDNERLNEAIIKLAKLNTEDADKFRKIDWKATNNYEVLFYDKVNRLLWGLVKDEGCQRSIRFEKDGQTKKITMGSALEKASKILRNY